MKRKRRKQPPIKIEPAIFNGESWSFFIPVQTRSEMNLREHWAAKAKRAKAHQEIAALCVTSCLLTRVRRAIRDRHHDMMLIREGGRPMDPDNLAASMKHIQDGITRAIGIDDGSKRLNISYAQLPDNKTVRGVLVIVTERSGEEGEA